MLFKLLLPKLFSSLIRTLSLLVEFLTSLRPILTNYPCYSLLNTFPVHILRATDLIWMKPQHNYGVT